MNNNTMTTIAAPRNSTNPKLTALDFKDITIDSYMVWKDYIVHKIESIPLYHKEGESKEEHRSIEHNKLVIDIWLMFEDRARQAITAVSDGEMDICLEDMGHNFSILEHMANVEGNELARELTDDCSQLRLLMDDIKNHKVFDMSTREFLGAPHDSVNPKRVVRFAV